MLLERNRAFDRIELIDGLAPLVFLKAGRLLRMCARAGCDHEKVIVEDASVGEFDMIMIGLDNINRGENKFDAIWQEIAFRPDHVVLGVDAKRNKEKAGLVIVDGILIDNCDFPIVLIEKAAHPICHHCAGSPGAEN